VKLTITTQISVDGVMQGPGGPDENRAGGFERGGWAHFDHEAGTAMDEIYQRADALLFGRRTYESFAGSWGTWPRHRPAHGAPAARIPDGQPRRGHDHPVGDRCGESPVVGQTAARRVGS
jgi:dihydrofolate reductase